MFNSNSGYSLADIAAATGNNNCNNGGWNDGGAWWIIILFLFCFAGGWGNGRGGLFGGSDSTGSGITDGYILTSDFANIERKLDSVNNGICDGFYAMNTGMLNGFGGVQQTLCQGFSGVNNAITQNGYETRLGIQGLSSDLASCCCDLKQEVANVGCSINRNIDSVNYNMAMNTNQLQNVMCNNTRDIIESNNANYRALHDEIVANKLEAKNDRIAEQQNEINALRLAASQEKQNNYLVNELKPCPIPAYITCNPYQSYPYPYGYTNNGCGCNTGCNCGNF